MIRQTIVASCVLVLMLAGIARGQETAKELDALLKQTAPSIVTVKVVLKTEIAMMGQVQDQESRLELQGVVVDPKGLIMLSNAPISGERMMEMMGGMGGGMQFDIKVTPVEFKVVVEREEEEYEAFLAAKDTKLDLAFIQVEGLGERALQAVVFGKRVKPAIGERVFSVTRMKKGYDYAPYFESSRIGGAITKPRKAWILDGGLSGFGLPVLARSGDTIGVLTTISSGVKDDSGAGGPLGVGGLMRMLSGGGTAAAVGGFVLPGSVVKAVIAQAMKQAEEVAAERAAAAEKASKEEAEEGDKKPDDKPSEGESKDDGF
ncbi:hypothetical protein ACFL59_00870 [Planctomycetota bacterium]